MKEREIKPMPTGSVWSWAKKAIGVKEVEVKAWDMERVIRRFVQQEGCQAWGGEWDE